MNNYYVYEWIRLDTNEPFYIGKGKGNRWSDLKRGNNQHFNNIVKSIPIVVNILHENLEESEAYEYECWYINEYKYILGYELVNLTDGGDNPPHGIGDKNNNYKNYWSDEQKKKASERIKSSGEYKGENNPRATKIMCIETGEIYSHIKEVAEKLKMKNQASISVALKEKWKTAYGYHWCIINNINFEFMNNRHNRFIYLVECYSELKNTNNIIICLEDMTIFKNRNEFIKFSHISTKYIQQKYRNHESIIHNNKLYIFARDYSRII